RQQVDLRDLVAFDDLGHGAVFGGVERFVLDADHAPVGRQVAGHDRAAAMALDQGMGQFGTDLAVGVDDQDARGIHASRPSSRPACVNAYTACSRSARSCTALICTRMRAWPLGTTGKKNPTT